MDVGKLDDDVSVSTVSIPAGDNVPRAKKKWSGSEVILPIKGPDGRITAKNIEDTTNDEFIDWLRQVMPFTPEMLNAYLHTRTSKKDKNSLFEAAVILHHRRWLFALDKEIISVDTKWN